MTVFQLIIAENVPESSYSVPLIGTSCHNDYDEYSRNENKRPPYWNSTSGFDFDLFTVVGMWLCIGLPDFMQIEYSRNE